MKKIQTLIDQIDEELCGAKDYAECYISAKAVDDSAWATRYREMSNDELKHAMYLHEKVVADIERLSKVYTPPVEMEEAWEKAHKHYIEKVAWIKQMLAM